MQTIQIEVSNIQNPSRVLTTDSIKIKLFDE